MVKLYYTPTSCGAANFIAAHIAGLTIESETVELSTHKTASGKDFYEINAKGNVPTIVLDDGTLLRENSATLQWIADQKPGTLAPAPGSAERYAFLDALSTVNTEIHGAFGPLFNPAITDDARAYQLTVIERRLKYVAETLLDGGKKEYLTGDKITVADIYLYIVLSWAGYLKVDLSGYPIISAYYKKVSELDSIKAGHARIAEAPSTVN